MKKKVDILVYRTLDAAINRAAEGLRVLEDFQRMVVGDKQLTKGLKALRHELAAVTAAIPLSDRLAARDSRNDVGKRTDLKSEYERAGEQQLVTANFSRVQQALRTVEEFAKLMATDMALSIERLRFETYDYQKAIDRQFHRPVVLAEAHVYLLTDGGTTLSSFENRIRELLNAGLRLIQLRDKALGAYGLLERGRVLTELCRSHGACWIMNDRVDLALASGANGVHLGQEDLPLAEARRLVGPDFIIGISTHSLDQATEAEMSGADYIGVGPVFPSGTKSFRQFPGLNLVQQVAKSVSIPAFAIGGIHEENVHQVMESGLSQIAAQGAITQNADPVGSFRKLNACVAEAGSSR